MSLKLFRSVTVLTTPCVNDSFILENVRITMVQAVIFNLDFLDTRDCPTFDFLKDFARVLFLLWVGEAWFDSSLELAQTFEVLLESFWFFPLTLTVDEGWTWLMQFFIHLCSENGIWGVLVLGWFIPNPEVDVKHRFWPLGVMIYCNLGISYLKMSLIGFRNSD